MIVNVELVDFLATDGVLNNGYLVNSGSKKIVIATHGMSSNCFKEREKTISTKLNENGIDFFVYNSRGSELVKYVKKIDSQGNETKCLGGTSYEDPKEGYYDILGAIKEMVNRGYEEIYLQGHSLGSTKVLYTYNKLKEENSYYLKFVKGIILLSLVDIPRVLKIYLKERYDEVVSLVKDIKESGRELELMKPGSFIHPISVKSFLCYSIDSEEIDFARYSKICSDIDKEKLLKVVYDLSELENSIKMSSQKIIIFQAGLIKLCNKEQGNTNSDLERRIKDLEDKLRNGVTV